MTRDRALRRLAAMGLLLGLAPLPFTGIVLPPFWIAAALAAVAAFVRPRPLELSNRVMNLLAVVFVVVVLAAGGWRVGPLRPLGQLLVLLAAVRVLTVADRRSFSAALIPNGLVWILAVASSTHVTLVLYLAVSMAGLWWGGMRAFLLVMSPEEMLPALRGAPRVRHAALAGLAVLLLAVPVFFAMPRLRSPVLAAGRGSAGVTGFRTSVDLSGIGEIRRSGQVAMVVSLRSPGELHERWLRLRATAFNLLRTGTWVPRRTGVRPLGGAGEVVRIDGGSGSFEREVQLDVELLRPQGYLFIPPGTVAVRSPLPVSVDRAGGLVVPRFYHRPIVYTVWIRSGFLVKSRPPEKVDLFVPRSGAALKTLTRTVTSGALGSEAVAHAVESYLRSNYRYTLEIPRHFSNDPVTDFLFVDRRGHCELFAGAMVMMLRSVGIPARMVGGFSGGDLGPRGRVVHVRRSNAHTWVEVWLGEDRGWRTFDPTPAEEVPGIERAGLLARVRWTADKVQVLWDRYILTFGLQDQLDLVSAGVSALLAAVRALKRWAAAAALVILGLVLWILVIRPRRRGRRRGDGRSREVSKILARLARRLERCGVSIAASVTPRSMTRKAARLWPDLGPELAELAGIAELELYGRGAGPEAPSRLREIWEVLRTRAGRSAAGA